MELANAIEAILFYRAEPMTLKQLSQSVKRSEGEVRDALANLKERLGTTGLRLLENGDEFTLGTSPDTSALIEAITKEELSRELSKASLETLAIVLYKGPVTRAEIDYVRGVNSTFILRNLQIRGLVEKIDNPNDLRSYLYKPTFQLLEFMGVTSVEDLPEYHNSLATLSTFIAEKETVTQGEAEEETKTTDEESIPAPDSETVVEANIAELDEAGGGFRDEELSEHEIADELDV